MMLNIFSCSCLPPIYSLWWNVMFIFFPFYSLDFLLLLLLSLISLYVPWISSLSSMWFANIYSQCIFFLIPLNKVSDKASIFSWKIFRWNLFYHDLVSSLRIFCLAVDPEDFLFFSFFVKILSFLWFLGGLVV